MVGAAAAATEPDQMEISLIGKSVTPLFDHPSVRALSIVLLKDGLKIQRLISPKIERSTQV